MTPILIVPCAKAVCGEANNASAAAPFSIDRLCMSFLLRQCGFGLLLLPATAWGTPAGGMLSTIGWARILHAIDGLPTISERHTDAASPSLKAC